MPNNKKETALTVADDENARQLVKLCKYYRDDLKKLNDDVCDFYELDGCSVGGPLHIVLDDENVDDHSIQYCLRECLAEKNKIVAEAGRFICEKMLSLTEEERRIIVHWGAYIRDGDTLGKCIEPEANCEKCYIKNGFDVYENL